MEEVMRLPISQMIPVFCVAVATLLIKFANSRILPKSIVERAKIALMSADGKSNKEISSEVSVKANTIGIWRRRIVNKIAHILNIVAQNITECEVYSQFSLHISGISDFNCNFFDNRFFF